MEKGISVTADFGGGLDLVFGGSKQIVLQLQVGATVQSVISALSEKHSTYKKEMFAVDGKMYVPGILVLINDADWELFEKEQSQLQHKDRVSFISTLHGG